MNPLGSDEGMTLRDYFAAAAVTGLMTRSWEIENKTGSEIMKTWAASAYAVADYMLAEREKPI